MPYWSFVLLTGGLAAAFGIRRPFKFSLRTSILVMTIVSVELGLIIYAAKK